MNLATNTQAFTIIELLIVIVVIGILATIVLNTVTGIQARARDTKIRTDLESIMDSLEAYNVDNGTHHVANSGSQGAGIGWFNYRDSGDYTNAVSETLIAEGYNHGVERADPPNSSNRNLYLIYYCLANRKVAVFGWLEAPTAEDNQTNTDWVNQGCTNYPCASLNRCFAIESTATWDTW